MYPAFALLLSGAIALPGAQSVNAEEAYTPGQKVDKTFNDFAQVFLDNYCIDCHDDASRKGNLSGKRAFSMNLSYLLVK